jgi:hypothetical protein
MENEENRPIVNSKQNLPQVGEDIVRDRALQQRRQERLHFFLFLALSDQKRGSTICQ